MKIGNIDIENKIFLAPMAGVADRTFRKICKDWGAGMTYSEMVSAKGLYYNDKKTAELLTKDESETPFTAQIFGSEPEIVEKTVDKALSYGADILDINMGCPAPKIVNNGDGSALMKKPELAEEVLRSAIRGANGVPVTVKFRAGWDDSSKNALDFALRMQECGAAAVTIHPRTRMMFYNGDADWSIIKQIKDALDIPVIGSGDIKTAQDAPRMMEETGCDAVMIGRGAQGNPFIFRQVHELITQGEVSFFPTGSDRLKAALLHARMLCEDKGESRGIKEARKHLAWYIKGISGASELRVKLFAAQSLSEVEALLEVI